MHQSSDEQMTQLLDQIRLDPGLAEGMSGQEGEIVRAALSGQNVYEIAQQYAISEKAVWERLAQAARAATGSALHQVETGGLGSDTDPGVTGGYGDTGFGSLDPDAPEPLDEPTTDDDEDA